jgi:hypothetical protein
LIRFYSGLVRLCVWSEYKETEFYTQEMGWEVDVVRGLDEREL